MVAVLDQPRAPAPGTVEMPFEESAAGGRAQRHFSPTSFSHLSIVHTAHTLLQIKGPSLVCFLDSNGRQLVVWNQGDSEELCSIWSEVVRNWAEIKKLLWRIWIVEFYIPISFINLQGDSVQLLLKETYLNARQVCFRLELDLLNSKLT